MGLEEHQRTVSAQKRTAILGAARRLFGAQGFERVTMNLVAREASVSLATVYKHFSGKEELFHAIFNERCEAFVASLQAIQLEGYRLEEGLCRFARGYATLLSSENTVETLRLLIGEATAFPSVVGLFFDQVSEALREPLARFVTRQLADGRLRIERESRALRELLGMVEGGVLWRSLLNGPAVTEAHIEEVADSAVTTWLARYRAVS
ncbi:MAG: TetR/AcrR family transcriptional regulator [Sandaracinaceae bacterium]